MGEVRRGVDCSSGDEGHLLIASLTVAKSVVVTKLALTARLERIDLVGRSRQVGNATRKERLRHRIVTPRCGERSSRRWRRPRATPD
jgi:hypothetical protein